MKISSLAKPTAAALALTFCGTHYVSAQENDSVQTPSAEQADNANKTSEDDAKKDRKNKTCPICGLRVEAKQDDAKGLKVASVKADSAADKAGIKKGDTLISINDKQVDSADQMHQMMSDQQQKSDEAKVNVQLRRGEEDQQVTLTLKSQDAQKADSDNEKKKDDTKNQASLGVTLDPSPSQDGEGVRISSVYTNGPAQQAGLKTGDRILKVDGKDISNVKDLQDSIDKMDPNHNAKITVMVDGKKDSLEIVVASKAETIKRAMVSNQPTAAQPAQTLDGDQPLSQTLTEIRDELRDLRQRVDAMEKGDNDNDGDREDEKESDSDVAGQNL